ncbi:hypothetical protein BI330_17245 [Mycobacterium sp. CBMA 623]|nr:hypothetical protein [Mycobacteroides sp. CBMA 326]
MPNIYTDYYAKGYWVVVDVTCGTLVADTPILAYLHSAGVRTSPRTTVSISKGQPSDFQPGLKYRFPIIFEIPSGSDEMTVSFMNWFKDDRSELTMDAPLDSELEIKIPSNEIQVRPMLTIRGSEVQ